MTKFLFGGAAALLLVIGAAGVADAQTLPARERLCDPTYEDCRADILTYIQQETVEIDMAYWMMTDARYSNALVAAHQRGVTIRVLMDPRCVDQHPACTAQNDQLAAAGVPMRNRITSGILHWKAAIFAGQGQIEFAGANYAPFELTPEEPWVNYTDEIILFTNNPSLVHSFMRKFDDLWTSDDEFANFANITRPLGRVYPTYDIDPELNFPPDESYRDRSLEAYAAETQGIDALMFRITDEQQTDGVIAAHHRGVPVRLITDDTEYRNPARLWDAYNVDKMYAAGVQVRMNAHQGINHEKAVLLRGLGMSIFGSSNWTSPSSDRQREHNLFTTRAFFYDWLEAQFTRKWTNGAGHTETKAFVPLPPDAPVPNEPAQGVTGVATTGTSLSFYAGLWAHNYDIYFGTAANPPLLEAGKHLGPSQYDTDYRYYALPPLQPNTTYYWKIVSKTMAGLTAEGPVRSFTTGNAPPANRPPTVSLTSPSAGQSFAAGTVISLAATAADEDGTVARVDFYAGDVLLASATTAPYGFSWSGAAPGAYTIDAVATDDKGATAASGPVTITVTSAPPAVALTSPANNGLYNAGTTITLRASASDSDGTIAKVEFFAGATKLGTATAAPYSFDWTNVPAGTYSLTAVATDSSGFTTTSSAVAIRVIVPGTPQPYMSVDMPGRGSTVRQPFGVAGWALDMAASDNGVDVVHVWAVPVSGAAPIFVGAGAVGGARADVGAVFGASHDESGYWVTARGLPPGGYILVVYAHSTVSNSFALWQTVDITVEDASHVQMDVPAQGDTLDQGFVVAGWAVDFGATSGAGIDLLDVYAVSLDRSESPHYLGQARVGSARGDVGQVFGAQFTPSGWFLRAPALPAGTYRIIAYGHSVVAGAFTTAAVADVTLR